MDVSPPDGSFLFLWASERSGFMHLYLYQYVPGAEHAVEVRQITSGEWVVESVVGVDQVRSNPRRKRVFLRVQWPARSFLFYVFFTCFSRFCVFGVFGILSGTM